MLEGVPVSATAEVGKAALMVEDEVRVDVPVSTIGEFGRELVSGRDWAGNMFNSVCKTCWISPNVIDK